MNNRILVFLILLFFSYTPACLFGNSLNGKKRIVFIVNPISHEIKGVDIQRII